MKKARIINKMMNTKIVNTERINQKLQEVEESLEIIKEGLPDEIDEFKLLGLVKDGIYKRLEFCIQNLIDIFSMIYSSLHLGVPQSIDDVFVELVHKKIFSKEIISLVQEMKGLRNILIHRYGKINEKIVYGLLKERLDDFERIIAAIEKKITGFQ